MDYIVHAESYHVSHCCMFVCLSLTYSRYLNTHMCIACFITQESIRNNFPLVLLSLKDRWLTIVSVYAQIHTPRFPYSGVCHHVDFDSYYIQVLTTSNCEQKLSYLICVVFVFTLG